MSELSPPHPVFARFTPWSGTVERDVQVNWLGVQTSVSYYEGMTETPEGEIATSYPAVDEELFEWIDLVETVTTGRDEFVMVELGAGWGRWLANAAAACEQVGRTYRLAGVEAEPTHFAFMCDHLERNQVDMDRVSLVEAAVAGRNGVAKFRVGASAACYGQRIVQSRQERRDWRRHWRGRTHRVRTLTFASVLDEAGIDGIISFVDLDVQSAEADVLEPAAALLDERVRRIHVGTHPGNNEERLRVLFRRLGWECLNDYPWGKTVETRFGPIAFQDGVQTWANPRL